jgi:voltage-gated potassium channel Kch
MAQYPTRVAEFTQKVDLQSIVFAADINTAYDEIVATQSALGSEPTNGGVWGSGTFTTGTQVWSNVSQRIKNIENGVFTLNNTAVRTTGASTIVPTTASTVGLAIRAQTSQTGNLLEFRDSSNTVVSRVTSSGAIVASIDGGTA